MNDIKRKEFVDELDIYLNNFEIIMAYIADKITDGDFVSTGIDKIINE